MEELKKGDLCKHFKGKDLLEKNIYQIIEVGVIYTGENEKVSIENLVVYKNIFQENKVFIREYDDLVKELSEEKYKEYGQIHRIEKLTEEETQIVKEDNFIKEKLEYMKNKDKKGII